MYFSDRFCTLYVHATAGVDRRLQTDLSAVVTDTESPHLPSITAPRLLLTVARADAAAVGLRPTGCDTRLGQLTRKITA